MIKRYCDHCGKEVKRNVVNKRYMPQLTRDGITVKAEVIVSVNGVWNSGDLCLRCLLAVLKGETGMDHARALERELEWLDERFAVGLISRAEYDQEYRLLMRDYQGAAEQAADEAREEELRNWY